MVPQVKSRQAEGPKVWVAVAPAARPSQVKPSQVKPSQVKPCLAEARDDSIVCGQRRQVRPFPWHLQHTQRTHSAHTVAGADIVSRTPCSTHTRDIVSHIPCSTHTREVGRSAESLPLAPRGLRPLAEEVEEEVTRWWGRPKRPLVPVGWVTGRGWYEMRWNGTGSRGGVERPLVPVGEGSHGV
jgi:hypothetical protein